MAIGPWQIVLIALVIVVLFGASRLGDIGKGLGEGIRNFKKGIADEEGKKLSSGEKQDSGEKQNSGDKKDSGSADS